MRNTCIVLTVVGAPTPSLAGQTRGTPHLGPGSPTYLAVGHPGPPPLNQLCRIAAICAASRTTAITTCIRWSAEADLRRW